ncbi:hypothetical protein SEVIR_8G191400v4 [Setaria viridis]|uniref:NB-ARC domain-containing protein n=2 Tax=Setaria viridis TaxID=4556 RepID=A0A4U6TK77_SETVI|nr:disease resistance protein PIK6-NP-like [Setaria viridis]TKW01594.1 hypothetical protein SEVIR_8G191400v2 [Setaria viridis]
MELGTGAIGSLLPKLVELLKEEYGFHEGVRKKIKSLSRELESIHAVLRKVGEVHPDQLEELVKLWAHDVRELSYDMEDIVDTFLVRIDDGPEHVDARMLRRLRKKMAKIFKKCKHQRKIAGAIRDMNKRVEEVAARRDRYTVDNVIAKLASPATIDPRMQALYKKTAELVGIEKQSEKLVKILSLGDGVHASDEAMKIVSIVGFGGLGKTTLSKAVYDKHKPAFDCGAFVPVGRDPDMKKVLRDILIDFDYVNPNVMILDERQLINELRKFIHNKRCLFVIDDIWDKKSWELIRCALQHSNCRSRVVVTTRIFEVATHIGDIYKMQPLSRDDSEILLYSRITGGEDRFLDSLSTEACDKILKKCGGVPLAIITIASLLASKSGEDWAKVYNSIGFGDRGNDIVENTRRILSFSYYDLPSHLKPCLLYVSLFREEYGIQKNLLIWKWIAEGFIQNEQATTEIELFELGEGYFNELINRSMIQPMEREDNGYVYGCRVHDMVLDLVRSLSSEEKFTTILDSNDQQKLIGGSNTRRFAVHGRSVEESTTALSWLTYMGLEKVRSFSATNINVVISCFRVLRVLTIEDCSVGEAWGKHRLQHLGSLRHLRYLGILDTQIDELPKEVGDLKFLQTLNLSGTGMQQLPEGVGLLKQLLCLRVNDSITVPSGLIGNLTLLQELKIWPADDASTRQLIKDLGELRELRMLQCTIHVSDESMERDLLESLANLHKIRTLFVFGSALARGITSEEVCFVAPPRCLGQMCLECFKFSALPVWMDSTLVLNLTHLDVTVNLVQEQDMETLGRLPELCYLKLSSDHTRLLSIRKTTGDLHRYFRKLRFFHTPFSFVQFDSHGCESDDDATIAHSIMMPSLESLVFSVYVRFIKDMDIIQPGFENLLGFENVAGTSLQRVTATIQCEDATAAEVEEAKAALAHAADLHPNCPALRIQMENKHKMLSTDREVSGKIQNGAHQHQRKPD